MSNSLAIIIPVYKIDYFEDCLRSIANQTDKNFNLYIGNDNSPYYIDGIVCKYNGEINITYKKFDDNFGRESIVKHWERCIQMTGDEKWIWLFSDDDIMDEKAVESFYTTNPQVENVYRFNLNVIDGNQNLLDTINFPESETAVSFLFNRLNYSYLNVITNYVFSKETYVKHNGFVDFPLAWGSDDASIFNFSESGNILLIKGSNISWRHSGINISTVFDPLICEKKITARIEYVEWLYKTKKNLFTAAGHKKIVAKWFFHGVKIEYSKVNDWKKIYACSKILRYVGFVIFLLFLSDKKSELKNWIYNLYKDYKPKRNLLAQND